jgi:quercetin dioxygenase-like cupin family protein
MSNGACELIQCGQGSQLPPAVDCPTPAELIQGDTTGAGGARTKEEMRGLIINLELAMKAMPERQIEIPTFHHFAPGVYMREVRIPKGAALVGMIHKTEHLNILSKGKLRLATEDGVRVLEASMVVKSTPGIKRAAEAIEDSVWITVHPNVSNEQDVEKLKADLVVDTFEQFLAFREGEKKCLSSQ